MTDKSEISHGGGDQPMEKEQSNLSVLVNYSTGVMEGDRFSYSVALALLKDGIKIKREEWSNAFLVFVPGTQNVELPKGSPYEVALHGKKSVANIRPHVDLYTEYGEFEVGWTPTQPDLHAQDWMIVLDKPSVNEDEDNS
ncbi:hypothetical protein AH06_290 [Erwinia phage AH06]|nr:hypothetical protein AH06_290 [Erwinia phage AH06]